MPRCLTLPILPARFGAAVLWGWLACLLPGQISTAAEGYPAIPSYLASLKKADGGYGWPDQTFGHVTATWATIGSYKILGLEPPEPAGLATFLRSHHPFETPHQVSIAHAAELRTLTFQQMQSLIWLNASVDSFGEKVGAWSEAGTYPRFYEQRGLPVFQEEVMGLLCRELLKMSPYDLTTEFQNQIMKRMRPNGSYNNTAAADETDGEVGNTLWGILASQYMGNGPGHREKLIAWLQRCQLGNGGFAAQPGRGPSESALYYTWAAVKSLNQCGARPSDPRRCIRFLLRHWQEDGGFAWQPEGPSDPLATYYALATLGELDGLEELATAVPQPARPAAPLPDGLRVISLQINAPGQGSPLELIHLAKALRIEHWITRNGPDGYREELAGLAAAESVPVIFDKAQEDYSLFLSEPGLGNYGRLGLVMLPHAAPDLEGPGLNVSFSWPEYRAWRLPSLQREKGLLAWNVCDNESFTRALLDDSARRGGYDLTSVFHFGGWDLLVNFPWLRTYQSRLPYVALNNAQGAQAWWWADQLAAMRTLYLAPDASWKNLLTAIEKNWIAAVRHDTTTGPFQLYGGTTTAREFIERNRAQWQWWTDGGLPRPPLSLVLIKPGDPFETPQPTTGRLLRVRTWWRSDAAGFPTEKQSELVSLSVDGKEVKPQFIEHRNVQGRLVDCYHRYDLPDNTGHIATATVRLIETGATYSQSIKL